jgi:hypothetical protein
VKETRKWIVLFIENSWRRHCHGLKCVLINGGSYEASSGGVCKNLSVSIQRVNCSFQKINKTIAFDLRTTIVHSDGSCFTLRYHVQSFNHADIWLQHLRRSRETKNWKEKTQIDSEDPERSCQQTQHQQMPEDYLEKKAVTRLSCTCKKQPTWEERSVVNVYTFPSAHLPSSTRLRWNIAKLSEIAASENSKKSVYLCPASKSTKYV